MGAGTATDCLALAEQLGPQAASDFLSVGGDETSNAACLPGCGLYLVEGLSSTLFRIITAATVPTEHLLYARASTRPCEVGIGHFPEEESEALQLLCTKLQDWECQGRVPHTCAFGVYLGNFSSSL